MKKQCTRCKTDKDLSEFYNRSDGKSKDGKESNCKSCGLKKKKAWYQEHCTDPKARRMHAISTAKQRNLKFDLSLKLYAEFLQKGCHYCQVDISQDKGTGLDRLDNDKGYTRDNVVPCCKACNLGRNDNFSPKEWMIMIKALKEFRNRG